MPLITSCQRVLFILSLLVSFPLFLSAASAESTPSPDAATPDRIVPMNTESTISKQTALFAGGCFWCMQPEYDQTAGVLETIVGYTGGAKANPTYEEVSSGRSGHIEAIKVVFDPAKVSYEKLLDIYWSNIDPTDKQGQFADRGSQYEPVIFYANDEQKALAEMSKQKLDASKKFTKPVAVEIRAASPFFDAEKYHQKYYKTNASQYDRYKYGSGRHDFIEKNWGKKE